VTPDHSTKLAIDRCPAESVQVDANVGFLEYPTIHRRCREWLLRVDLTR
jgi:hypothetical protein